MTNFEKYKDFFEKWAREDRVAILDNKPRRCIDITCSHCDLNKTTSCSTALVKWLYEEYKETPVLTKAQYCFFKSFNEDAKIGIFNRYIIDIKVGQNIYSISKSYLDAMIFSGFPELKPQVWYNVSDILKWKVVDDE